MSYCKMPFQKALIGGQGKVFFCCPSWLPLEIGNIFSEPDFNKIWNSDVARKIRISMINQTYTFCDKDYCPYLLQGVFSPSPDISSSLYETKSLHESVILDKGPQEMNLFYDHTCNLYCRFCRNKVLALDIKKTAFLLKFQRNLLDSPLFKDVRRLILSGQGEVMASKVYRKMLKNINEKRFPDLKITFLTNGLLFTPQNWKNISNVHYAVDCIVISVDAATKETYNYIRRGGNFDTLLGNLKFLSDLKKKHKLRLQATFVMQKENFREIPDFIRLMKKFDIEDLYFQKIINEGTFTDEEFEAVAIHRRDHPEHNEFMNILKTHVQNKPRIALQIKIDQ